MPVLSRQPAKDCQLPEAREAGGGVAAQRVPGRGDGLPVVRPVSQEASCTVAGGGGAEPAGVAPDVRGAAAAISPRRPARRRGGAGSIDRGTALRCATVNLAEISPAAVKKR